MRTRKRPGALTASINASGTMEHRAHEESDDQRQEVSRDRETPLQDRDVRVEIMDREQREKALAWAQAYRLIRGGVDEVVQFVEGSQYTIELLLQTLRDAACRNCEVSAHDPPDGCEFCQRRHELLARLA